MSGTEAKAEESDDYLIQDRHGLSDSELAVCLDLLDRGAAVNVETAATHLPTAIAQVVATHAGKIVGVGAVKRARPDYAAKISRSSSHPIDPATPELGYVTVDKKHRGKHLSSRMVSALIAATSGRLFATTDKDEMKTVLSRNGFIKCGRDWDGDNGCLTLWMRQPD